MPLHSRKIFENSGQALAEYALILALALLGIVSALLILQDSLEDTLRTSGRQIDAARWGGYCPVRPSAAGRQGRPAPARLPAWSRDQQRLVGTAGAGVKEDYPVDYIIRWIEQRGVGTYDVGWVCV